MFFKLILIRFLPYLYFEIGLFPPCSNHGYVRCCSRDGLEQLYAGMLKAVITQPRVQVSCCFSLCLDAKSKSCHSLAKCVGNKLLKNCSRTAVITHHTAKNAVKKLLKTPRLKQLHSQITLDRFYYSS